MSLWKTDGTTVLGDARAVVPKAVQAEQPLIGSAHVKKAQSAQSLFFMGKARTRSHIWPTPHESYTSGSGYTTDVRGTMPWANIAAARTFYDFQVGPFVGAAVSDFQTRLEVPWLHGADFESLEIHARFLCQSDIVLVMKASVITHLPGDSITTTTSSAQRVTFFGPLRSTKQQRFDRGRGWRTGQETFSITPTDLSSSGIISIIFSAMCPYDLPTMDLVPGNDPEGAEDRDVFVFLTSMHIVERMSRSNVSTV